MGPTSTSRSHPRRARWLALGLTAGLLLAACGAPAGRESGGAVAPTSPTAPPPRPVATGPASPEADRAAAALADDPLAPEPSAVEALARSDDLRFAWDLVERLRVEPAGEGRDLLRDALAELTEVEVPEGADPWTHYTDLLLAWDVEAPPGYLERKRALYSVRDPSVATLLDDSPAVDWRLVTPNGSGRDGVAPLHDPAVVTVDAVDWLADDDVVFVVTVGAERRAYPRPVLRAHEIVNDALGGQRVALTWCEVCGAAVAWRAARGDGSSIDLGSSGLLLAGAPVAYDRRTGSLVDTFGGTPLTGALATEGRALEPLPVTTTTWGDWAETAGPASVVAEDGGIGRVYLDEPAGASAAPWPLGARDTRWSSDDRVLGVHLPDGTTAALPVAEARSALGEGRRLRWAGVEVVVDGGGLVAREATGERLLGAHESTWAAWSRFHPDTELWLPGS